MSQRYTNNAATLLDIAGGFCLWEGGISAVERFFESTPAEKIFPAGEIPLPIISHLPGIVPLLIICSNFTSLSTVYIYRYTEYRLGAATQAA